MHAVVLYNPVSGRGKAIAVGEQAEAHLRACGFTTERIATSPDAGATQLAAEVAARTDLLVVAGGDGSLREALTGLGDHVSRVRVALLPLGNANVIARELGIPLDPGAAIAATTSGCVSDFDLGLVTLSNDDAAAESQLFLGMVGIGWDALVVKWIDRIRSSRLGRRWYRLWADSVYCVAGLIATFAPHPRNLRMRVDGEIREERFRAALACNTRTYGKGWSMAPGASARSGRLHFQARKRSLLPWLIWHLLAALRSRTAPAFISEYGSGRRLAFESDRPFAVQVDGDARGTALRVRLRVRPGAARIVVPKPAPH